VGLKSSIRLQLLADPIDALELRERVLLLVATIAVLFFSLDTLALQPTLKSQQAATERITEFDNRLGALRQQTSLLQYRSDVDSLQARRVQRNTLKQTLTALDTRIENQLGILAEPTRTTEVLEQVLTGHRGLKLISLDAGTRVSGGQKIKTGDKTGLNRYRIELVLDGSYTDVLAYLKQIESLPWTFYWQKIDFQHSEHSRATTRLQLYALSVDHG